MNVLMIMNGKGIGGAELQFVELANQLARKHRVTMVCLHGSNAVEQGRLDSGIEVLRFSYASGRRAGRQFMSAVRACRQIRADAIITTSFIANAVGRLARGSSKGRLVSLQTVSESPKYSTANRYILAGFDKLVAGCRDIRDYLVARKLDPERIEVVNNWVDFSSRITTRPPAETRALLGMQEEDIVIGCIGRMHYQKGQEFLIRAFREVAAEVPRARLVLVGDGPRMEEMKSEADGHPQIVFTGTIIGEEYTNLLGAFDIYVQPSRYEGLPRTLLDAMYMGRPVLVTAVNGHKDAIVDGVNGLMVPSQDPTALKNGLLTLLDDPAFAERLGAQAAKDARTSFAMEVQTGRIEEILTGS